MKKVMYAFMNWDMGKFIRCLRIVWDVNLCKITLCQKIKRYQILSSGGSNETASFLVCMNGIEEIAFRFLLLKNNEFNAWELELVKFFRKNT